jgi:hypothetical protein
VTSFLEKSKRSKKKRLNCSVSLPKASIAQLSSIPFNLNSANLEMNTSLFAGSLFKQATSKLFS